MVCASSHVAAHSRSLFPIPPIQVCLQAPRSDVLVKAKTGSGKTLAFLLPSIETIVSGGQLPTGRAAMVQLLVLAPTRELAM